MNVPTLLYQSRGRIRYVFVDVVDFTKLRTADEQIGVIGGLMGSVKYAVSTVLADGPAPTYIPTGDGLCIGMHEGGRYNDHIRLAAEIVVDVAMNENPPKYKVRIGVGEGTDLCFRDINNCPNFAGKGINSTARAMTQAEPNQIVVTEEAYQSLEQHERYQSKLEKFTAVIKDTRFVFYRFNWPGWTGEI